MLSSFKEMDEASRGVGAQGFVLKTEVADVLLDAVDRLYRRETFFNR
jgi:DNA-binding NarL/FixJ family response regulator